MPTLAAKEKVFPWAHKLLSWSTYLRILALVPISAFIQKRSMIKPLPGCFSWPKDNTILEIIFQPIVSLHKVFHTIVVCPKKLFPIFMSMLVSAPKDQ